MKIKLNKNFELLQEKYLFAEINSRVERFNRENGEDCSIISLGIGDVSLPLPSVITREMARASIKMSTREGFRGYGNTLGEQRLRESISNRYLTRNVHLTPCEIFINDGAKTDLSNINDVLGDNEILIFNPVYPVYLDASIISGRRVHQILADE